MFERRLFFHVDWLLLAAILVITGIGVAMIYSTTYVRRLPVVQLYAISIGAVAFVIFLAVDYRALR